MKIRSKGITFFGVFLLISDGFVVLMSLWGLSLCIFSPEVEVGGEKGFFKSAKETGGCIIGLEISRAIKVDPELETDADYYMGMIETIKNDKDFFDYENIKNEIVIIGGKEGIKTIYMKEGEEVYTEIIIPVKDLIYGFKNGPIYSGKCTEKFDEILNTVEINK